MYNMVAENFLTFFFFRCLVGYSLSHEQRIQDDEIPNSLQPKTIYQTQLENRAKCMKISSFCRKNGLVVQNHGLKTHTQYIY